VKYLHGLGIAWRLVLARWLLPAGWHVQKNRAKKSAAVGVDLNPFVLPLTTDVEGGKA
jgi:hypothetical protein